MSKLFLPDSVREQLEEPEMEPIVPVRELPKVAEVLALSPAAKAVVEQLEKVSETNECWIMALLHEEGFRKVVAKITSELLPTMMMQVVTQDRQNIHMSFQQAMTQISGNSFNQITPHAAATAIQLATDVLNQVPMPTMQFRVQDPLIQLAELENQLAEVPSELVVTEETQSTPETVSPEADL